MAKRIKYNISQIQVPGPELLSFTLKTGSWKKMFRPEYYKTLIAEALNDTVYKGEFSNSIVGYLISEKRLCLVLYIHQRKVRRMLDKFYANLNQQIMNGIEALNSKERERFGAEITSYEQMPEVLFSEYKLRNNALVKLLTGRRVYGPDPDGNVQRLKNRLRNYQFSSIVDYKGGESPVLVNVLPSEEWRIIGRVKMESR